MREVVVDSSVAIKWFVAEVHSAEAQRLLNDYQAGTIGFAAPDLLACEIGSIVWKKCQFQGLAAGDALLILNGFRALTFAVTSTFDLLDDAFRLATAHQRTVYDMTYVALSLRKSCDFVTADQKLFNALSPFFPNMLWVANWP